eukprot:15275088-Alexandrium_andersonii.AAC.1
MGRSDHKPVGLSGRSWLIGAKPSPTEVPARPTGQTAASAARKHLRAVPACRIQDYSGFHAPIAKACADCGLADGGL